MTAGLIDKQILFAHAWELPDRSDNTMDSLSMPLSRTSLVRNLIPPRLFSISLISYLLASTDRIPRVCPYPL